MSNINSNIDMRTPLAKAMGLGTAKSGTSHFWQQRITALFNVPLYLFFLCLFINCVGKGYEQVHKIFTCPVVTLFSLLAILSGLYHMKIGLQVVIEDYISNHIKRVLFLALNSFACYAGIIICILAVIKINFGS